MSRFRKQTLAAEARRGSRSSGEDWARSTPLATQTSRRISDSLPGDTREASPGCAARCGVRDHTRFEASHHESTSQPQPARRLFPSRGFGQRRCHQCRWIGCAPPRPVLQHSLRELRFGCPIPGIGFPYPDSLDRPEHGWNEIDPVARILRLRSQSTTLPRENTRWT
jgi:hypothetical protein